MNTVTTISMAPTWGDVGALYERLLRGENVKGIAWDEFRRAFAMAEAYKQVVGHPTTTAAARVLGAEVMQRELRKTELALGPVPK